MPSYHEAFRVGERVQIVDEVSLRAFQEAWAPYHHAPTEEQMACAGMTCFIRNVTYYHGGDCLYELFHFVLDTEQTLDARFPQYQEEALPGFWHESCLVETFSDEWESQLPIASEIYKITAEERHGQPIVVINTHTGIECFTKRYLENEREALAMSKVASIRNARAFEVRYGFHGVMADASRARFSNPSAASPTDTTTAETAPASPSEPASPA